MAASFFIKALPAENFHSLFKLSDKELALQNAKWLNVDSDPGYPCRVSLADAKVGERVLVLAFDHHDVDSPYRASGPIVIRENSVTAKPNTNEVPKMFRHRLLSIRAYDLCHMMIDAQVVAGTELELVIESQFNNSAVEYIHIHNANRGCFDCAVYRA